MTNESTEKSNGEPISPEEVVAQEVNDVVEEVTEAVVEISAEQQKINELELALATAKATVSDQKDSVILEKALGCSGFSK